MTKNMPRRAKALGVPNFESISDRKLKDVSFWRAQLLDGKPRRHWVYGLGEPLARGLPRRGPATLFLKTGGIASETENFGSTMSRSPLCLLMHQGVAFKALTGPYLTVEGLSRALRCWM